MINRIKNYIITWLGGIVKQAEEKKEHLFNAIATSSEMNENYLFDFLNWSSGRERRGETTNEPILIGGPDGFDSPVLAPTKKISMKPIDVVKELEYEPHPFNLEHLDGKVAMLKEKEKLIVQYYAKREVGGLIERLELRKKYKDFKNFFEQFQNTTEEKIDVLLSKYELVMKSSDIFIPEFPDDAVNIMKAYTEKVDELCGKKPVFYVIAEDILFKKAYKRNDPILLVQSPFGFYWQILGAWDKEMLILGDL